MPPKLQNQRYETVQFDAKSDCPGADNNSTDGGAERVGGKFKGTYSSVTFNAEDKSVLFLGAENKLYWPSTAMQIGSCRAYFKLNDPTQVKEFKLCFDGEDSADGIGKIQNSKFKIQNEADAIYNLAGQRLSKMQRGINIVNGKKILK